MGRFLNLKLPLFSRKNQLVFLALCWFLGLLTGAAASAEVSDSLIPMMRTAANSSVLIDGLLTAIILPFLLSAFAVLIHELWLLFPISFLKAFLTAFLGFGILKAYGPAGWLVRLLLMFGDCCSLPLLLWYWTRAFSRQERHVLPATAAGLLVAAAIGSIDYCIVSPFLATVIS